VDTFQIILILFKIPKETIKSNYDYIKENYYCKRIARMFISKRRTILQRESETQTSWEFKWSKTAKPVT
jgi:hypothetical protein